jgi:hypothetical protein
MVIFSALADPVAIVTGLCVGLLLLDMRLTRVQTAVMLLGVFIWTAIGASFELDVRNGAYNWVENQESTYRPGYTTTHYLDDKPAKLQLELTRFAATLFWLGLIRFGIPAIRGRRNGN